jgi:hypothetical protein
LGRVDLWKGYLSTGANADLDAPKVKGVARVLADQVAADLAEEEEVGATKGGKGIRVYP